MLSTPLSAGAATVVNGDFETGTLSGWQVVDSSYNGSEGSWFEYEEGESPQPPPQGTYAATTDQEGPGTHILYQNVALEPNFTHTLSMTVYYESFAPLTNPTPDTLNSSGGPSTTTFEQNNQQYRVDVIKPSAAIDSLNPADVLTTVFATKEDDPQTLPPTTLTASLTQFAGQTVRLRLVEVDNQKNFNAEIDAISIASTPVVTPTPPSNAFTFGKLKLDRKNGTGQLGIGVPGQGSLTVIDSRETVISARGRPKVKAPVALIKRASLTASAAGPVTITLKPTAAGRKILKAKHKLGFSVLVTFTPTGGTAASQTFKGTLKLKAKKPKPRPGR